MSDTITRFVRNVCLPHLRTILDSNRHIRSDQVKEDVIEGLHLHYFEYKRTLHPGKTGKSEHDRGFHPPEFYVFVRQGPAVIGGQKNVFLLQFPVEIQKALGDCGGSRKRIRVRNSQDLEGEVRENKKRVVTSTLTSVHTAT